MRNKRNIFFKFLNYISGIGMIISFISGVLIAIYKTNHVLYPIIFFISFSFLRLIFNGFYEGYCEQVRESKIKRNLFKRTTHSPEDIKRNRRGLKK